MDQNRQILDIASHIKQVKPDVEMMFIEQDVPMNSLQVEPSIEMIDLYPDPPSFESQIADFRKVFSLLRFTKPARCVRSVQSIVEPFEQPTVHVFVGDCVRPL